MTNSCRWWCMARDGGACDCAPGILPSFLASWLEEGLDVSQLPSWIGRRRFDRRMETVPLIGTWL